MFKKFMNSWKHFAFLASVNLIIIMINLSFPDNSTSFPTLLAIICGLSCLGAAIANYRTKNKNPSN